MATKHPIRPGDVVLTNCGIFLVVTKPDCNGDPILGNVILEDDCCIGGLDGTDEMRNWLGTGKVLFNLIDVLNKEVSI